MRGICAAVALLLAGCASADGQPGEQTAGTFGPASETSGSSTGDTPESSSQGSGESGPGVGSSGGTGATGLESEGSGSETGAGQSTGPSSIVFVDDRFAAGFDGWQDASDPGYQLDHDMGEGDAAPALRLSGDCQPSCDAAALKVVDVSAWPGTGTLSFSIAYRATSNVATSTVTNARLRITDADTHDVLEEIALQAGGTTDSGWQSFAIDLAPAVAMGADALAFRVWVRDAWAANHTAVTWFDNVLLTWP